MAVSDDEVVATFEQGWNAAGEGAPADSNPFTGDVSDDGKMRADLWDRGFRARENDPLEG